MAVRLTFKPLTLDRWPDFEILFGENGACGGCWCMAWRWKHKEFLQKKGAGAKRAFKKIVEGKTAPGILAYSDKEPVGWIAIAPREQFTRLEGSRVLAPIDDQPVWSIPCFFVRKDFRHKGVSVQLLEAAADFARKQKAKIVEGYPYDLDKEMPPPFVWTGLASAFEKAGFQEAARRSKTRPIMRKQL
ncbi:MAG TPA: GNAT family N-acetyltransferase [Terriglobales bacterium]|nr:GNAT family N-acetyltransferase [Terriglobales bacterium]